MMQPSVLINSPKGSNHLSNMHSRGSVVALLGSFISTWHPSNMPNGQKVTDDLANIIAHKTVSPRSVAIDRIRNSAFEHLMERYPKSSLLKPIVARAFYPTPPNPVHEAYAYLLNKGIVEHLITTNYDVGLEAACSAICSPERVPQVVVTEDDLTSVDDRRPVLFKIHGCASPGKEKSIVLTLGGEGEMPGWKRALLERLVNGKNLLVSGYSGLDFEICPELTRLTPSSITWNSYLDPSATDDALTANAKRVLQGSGGTPLVGDMNQMLKKLTGLNWNTAPPTVIPDLVTQLVNALDAWELDRWRVWVFNGLSCALDGIRVAENMYSNSGASTERQLDSLLAMSEALFHSGRYKQAGQKYRAAAQLASNTTDWDKIVKAEIGIIESDRVAGYWLQARRRIEILLKTLPPRVPSQEREKVISEIKLKRLLLRRYPFRLYKMLRLNSLAERVRRQAKQEFKEVVTFFALEGSWFNLQHCEMLAGKFDIPFTEIYSGTMTPLSSNEGYKQLGYILAEMMSYRGTLKVLSNPPVRADYVKTAKELGIYPEVWKLARAIEKKFGSSAVTTEFRREAQEAWRFCEYTLPMRLLLYWLGEET
jgi:hypothetical protein